MALRLHKQQKDQASVMRYLREQLSREVHPADVSFIEEMASIDEND